MRVALVLCVVAVALCRPLRAQETARVAPITQAADLPMGAPWISQFRRISAIGDAELLGKSATEFVQDLKIMYDSGKVLADANAPGPPAAPNLAFYVALHRAGIECCDITRNYYLVLFTAIDSHGNAAVASVLVHDPEPGANKLPGLKGVEAPLYELFVAEDSTVKIQGAYDVERVEDPATKQLADFVTTTLGKLAVPSILSSLPSRQGTDLVALFRAAPMDNEKATYAQTVTMARVVFPTSRAKLTAHHGVNVSNPVSHMSSVVDGAADDLRAQLSSRLVDVARLASRSIASGDGFALPQPVRTAMCDDFITSTAAAVHGDLAGDDCRFSLSDQSACVKGIKATLTTTLKGFKESDTCTAAQAQAVVSGFLPVVATELFRTSGTTALTNQPLQRYGFSLATGFIGAISEDSAHPRAQIQNGKIAVNPFSRALAYGSLDLPLWGYDPSTPDMALREKLKPFVGFAFTPYFGVTTGGWWALTRSIGVAGGVGAVWYDTPKDGETIDAAPVDKAAPFRLGHSKMWFIAATYNFSGGGK